MSDGLPPDAAETPEAAGNAPVGDAVEASDEFTEIRKPGSVRSLFSWRSLWRAFLLGVLCWVLTLVLITSVQRRLVFVGQSTFRNVDLRISSTGWDERQLRDVQVPMADGLSMNGWLALTTASSLDNAVAVADDNRPLVIYFGGNAGTRRMRLTSLRLLTELGCNVLIVDYRSFAENPGRPSEDGFLRDGREVVDYARTTLGVPLERIVLYGESLGGAVATGVAAGLCEDDLVPGGLVLRATFASMTETAGYHYPFLPVGLLLIDRFPSVDRIASVRCPVLQFHGLKDVVIPITHGRRLHEAIPDASDNGFAKTFVELPAAGHNNVLRTSYQTLSDQTAAWLKTIGLVGEPATP